MLFVYIHVIWFGCWIGFGVESYPYGLLTMIVSLEAIFLSTFVMISQNRADAKRQVIADEQWRTVREEDQQNKELLDLSRQILELTKEVRALAGRDDVRHLGSDGRLWGDAAADRLGLFDEKRLSAPPRVSRPPTRNRVARPCGRT